MMIRKNKDVVQPKQPTNAKENNNIDDTTKYGSLVLSIALFLFIVISIFAVTVYATRQTDRDNEKVNISSEMENAIQAITHNLFDMKLSFGENPNSPHIQRSIENIRQNSEFLTQGLNVFLLGGQLPVSDGTEVEITPISDPETKVLIENALTEWNVFLPVIERYSNFALTLRRDENALDSAINTSRGSSVIMFDNLVKAADNIKNQARAVAVRLEWVQLAGIAIAIIYFIVFIFFFVRRLKKSDRERAQARKETSEILGTVQEGLFLIDADLLIGTQQSEELGKILPISDISGKPLDEIISNFVSETDLTNTRRFINQLFNKRVKEKLLDDLNPLRQVRVMMDSPDERLRTHYLSFKFNRVYENKQIVRVLVTVSDITKSVELQKLLEHERHQNLVQTEMLIKVLHLDQELLAGFIRRTSQIALRVNTILKSSGNSQTQLRKKLNAIFREVHSFKGEASALEFDSFVVIAEEAEAKLKEIRERSQLTGNDFIGVAVILDRLMSLNEEISKIQARLTDFAKKKINDNSDMTVENHISLASNMEQFAKQIAMRQHKQVNLVEKGFEKMYGLVPAIQDPLREITVQLLRNAIVHGIENPGEREQKGKDNTGCVTIEYKQSDTRAVLTVEDDGRGIDLDFLRSKLANYPEYQDKDLASMDSKMLYRALFLPGFSTVSESNEDGGRGEGMCIVRDRIKQLPDGKIAIQSQVGQFTRFVISFAMLSKED